MAAVRGTRLPAVHTPQCLGTNVPPTFAQSDEPEPVATDEQECEAKAAKSDRASGALSSNFQASLRWRDGPRPAASAAKLPRGQ